MKNTLLCTLICSLFVVGSCEDGFTPADEFAPKEYTYSGEFMLIDSAYTIINGESFPYGLGVAPIQFTLSQRAESMFYTLYGKQYGIFKLDIFINDQSCFKQNGEELVIYEKDENQNDVVTAIMPDEFYRLCHFADDQEKPIQFIIKSKAPITK